MYNYTEDIGGSVLTAALSFSSFLFLCLVHGPSHDPRDLSYRGEEQLYTSCALFRITSDKTQGCNLVLSGYSELVELTTLLSSSSFC